MTAKLQTQEGQVEQENLQPSFSRPRRDFSVSLQQLSADLSKLDFRNLKSLPGKALHRDMVKRLNLWPSC